MGSESHSEEASTDLSDVLPGTSLTTLNVSGGTGGQGGRGGQQGGTGGNGEGPTFNVSGAAGWIVQINDRSVLPNSRTLGSAIDFAPPAISIWDINLQREVYLDGLQAYSRRRRNIVRRYYTAELKDRKEMTVVVYEGQNAKEELNDDVTKYMKFRHPSFLQLYGIVHSGNIHATIFHEALIPFRFRNLESVYRQSPMLPCYTYAYLASEFYAATDYIRDIFATQWSDIPAPQDYTFFLRPSTGRLCLDFEGHDSEPWSFAVTQNITPMSLLSTIDTQTIIDALTIEQYHGVCHRAFSMDGVGFFPLTATVHLGAIYHTAGHRNLSSPLAIARMLSPSIKIDAAWTSLRLNSVEPQIMESGWNCFRIDESDICGFPFTCVFFFSPDTDTWLSQASHIFNLLGVFSNLENYVLSRRVDFRISLQPEGHWQLPMPYVFLFLCPPQSFRIGPASFKLPKHIGYWSLDPLGMDPLSAEQAAELGLPSFDISIISRAHSAWSGTVYAGLRQFHQGFDPDSQDLARHLGVPLYELYSDHEKSASVDGGAAHIEELPTCDCPDQLEEGNEGEPIILHIEIPHSR
ncbi:hypothetical protein R3P38DRAFT_947925 [Favolaschia claudopus]|uniref:Uncharacterized protein n=1 Tax=Favolaschia claudopus TaxID=2862362 RepID=A0AAW0BM21_9AGAR